MRESQAIQRLRRIATSPAALGLKDDTAVLGDLVQMLAVEGGTRVSRDVERAHGRAARRIQCVEAVAGGEPDPVAVIRDAPDLLDARKRAIFADDFCG